MSFLIHVQIDAQVYLRDPLETKLGRRIIQYSILLIDELGIENFTFKKLAAKIQSTEASIYRYFENKHLLLLYLLSWYWEWLRCRIEFNTMNVREPVEKLKILVKTLVDNVRMSEPVEYVDRDALRRLAVAEGTKTYHNKEIDAEYRKGFFKIYSALNLAVAGYILAAQPSYEYPKMLANTILEMTNNQLFLAEHIPEISDFDTSQSIVEQTEKAVSYFICTLLGLEKYE